MIVGKASKFPNPSKAVPSLESVWIVVKEFVLNVHVGEKKFHCFQSSHEGDSSLMNVIPAL